MPFSIGLRIYRVAVRRKGSKEPLTVGPGGDPCDLIDFAAQFVDARATPTNETDDERTWYFDRKPTTSIRTIHGLIGYGTHGFESIIKDSRTKREKYTRQASDLEEIPLYFQIWVPSDAPFAMMAFQSFQGRSCVGFVRSAMTKAFAEAYPDYLLQFSIVAPSGALLADAPVKSVTFFNPRVTGDRADYNRLGGVEEVEYETTIWAKRRGRFLSTYSELRNIVRGHDGLVVFDGQEFESAKADIKLGNKKRTVGIFGPGFEAGLIDVTENVSRGRNGHPVFSSIVDQVDELMSEFFDGMKT